MPRISNFHNGKIATTPVSRSCRRSNNFLKAEPHYIPHGIEQLDPWEYPICRFRISRYRWWRQIQDREIAASRRISGRSRRSRLCFLGGFWRLQDTGRAQGAREHGGTCETHGVLSFACLGRKSGSAVAGTRLWRSKSSVQRPRLMKLISNLPPR